MSLDLRAIREALASRIQESCNLTAFPFDVSSVIYPRAIVMPGSPAVEYHTTFRDLCLLNFRIEVRAVAADPVSAQIALAEFCAAGTGQSRSVFDALETVTAPALTPDLDGVVENINVDSVELSDGVQLVEGPVEFTAVFNVAVMARRD
jgi:hypothetical protein